MNLLNTNQRNNIDFYQNINLNNIYRLQLANLSRYKKDNILSELKKLDLIILVVMLVEVVLVRGKECGYKALCCDGIRPPCRRIEWL